jgi:hypothetical protein
MFLLLDSVSDPQSESGSVFETQFKNNCDAGSGPVNYQLTVPYNHYGTAVEIQLLRYRYRKCKKKLD